MTATRRRAAVGDTAWRVEWCSALAFYEGTEDVDRDECTMSTRSFSTREKAMAFAKQIWLETTKTFGIVEVTPIQFVAYDEADAAMYPHAGFWEDVTDSEIISDESGVPE